MIASKMGRRGKLDIARRGEWVARGRNARNWEDLRGVRRREVERRWKSILKEREEGEREVPSPGRIEFTLKECKFKCDL